MEGMARDGTLVALQQLDVQVMIIIIMMTICWQQCQPSWYWWLLMMVILSCESVISFWTRSTALSRVWPAEDFLRSWESSSTSLIQHPTSDVIQHHQSMKIIIITITSMLPSRHIQKFLKSSSFAHLSQFLISLLLVRPLSLVHCFDNILLMLKRLSQETLPFYIPLQVWKKQYLTYQLSQMNCKNDLSESLWPYYSVLPTSIYFSKVGIHIELRDGLH